MPPPPATTRTWATVPFRVAASVQLVLLCAQPALIGQFLAGDFPRLEDHQAVGMVVMLTALVQVPAALLAWLVGRWPGWPVAASLGMLLASGVQLGSGFARNLGLHVPLGVVMVTLGAFLAVWAWVPRKATARAVQR